MSVHSNGTGTGWLETLDVDQPHGLDYREFNDVRIGTRKRVAKEHVTFADATAGGEHLPGGCRILGIVDSTSDLTKGAGDASIDVTAGKFIGRGLIYDQTQNSLWCFTNSDGTTTGNPYRLMFSPASICKGADFTWSGAHEFDASVDISGALSVDGTATVFGGTAGIGLFYDPTVYAAQQSIIFPNGLIMKQGVIGAGASVDVSFTAAFPTAILPGTIQLTQDRNATTQQTLSFTGEGVTGFTILCGDALAQNYAWMAWGY